MIPVPVLHFRTVFPTSIWLDRIIVVDLSFIQPLMETFLIPRPFKSHSTIPAFSSRNQSLGGVGVGGCARSNILLPCHIKDKNVTTVAFTFLLFCKV